MGKLNAPEGMAVNLLECKSIPIEAGGEEVKASVGMDVIWFEYKLMVASEGNWAEMI